MPDHCSHCSTVLTIDNRNAFYNFGEYVLCNVCAALADAEDWFNYKGTK